MTVQEILEGAVREMIPDKFIDTVIRKQDGNAYAWPVVHQFPGMCVFGFEKPHMLADFVEDGFIYIRRRSFLGVAGKNFDYRTLKYFLNCHKISFFA